MYTCLLCLCLSAPSGSVLTQLWATSAPTLEVGCVFLWGPCHQPVLLYEDFVEVLLFCFSELLSPGVKNKNFKCHRTYRLFAGECLPLLPQNHNEQSL